MNPEDNRTTVETTAGRFVFQRPSMMKDDALRAFTLNAFGYAWKADVSAAVITRRMFNDYMMYCCVEAPIKFRAQTQEDLMGEEIDKDAEGTSIAIMDQMGDFVPVVKANRDRKGMWILNINLLADEGDSYWKIVEALKTAGSRFRRAIIRPEDGDAAEEKATVGATQE